MRELKWCRNCIQWRTTHPFMGNCKKRPWEKDKWSQDADALGCEDYVDTRNGVPQNQTAVASAKEG